LEELEMDHFKRLYQILSRTIHLPQRKKPLPKGGQLVFLSPQDKRLCIGELEYFDEKCARFRTKETGALMHIQTGDIIENASLKQGEKIRDINFKVLGNKGILILKTVTEEELKELPNSAVLTI
ncbi:MAG: hypothetical protein PF447_01720, partial [Spirochaetaceae bacterium]|nr:hypothetical protein [Spirochaetaceae bacterium]